MKLGEIVDLERYPIDRPESPDLQAVVDHAREQLALDGCAVLDGFVKAAVVTRMAAESNALSPRTKAKEQRVTVYPPFRIPEDGTWPADHPRMHTAIRRNRFVAYDLLANDSPLRHLYETRFMTDMVRRCIGLDSLYLYGDPLGACALSIQNVGEELPWHFDVTHFVVSILIQQPEAGGAFEYAPRIRTDHDENYDGVSKVLQGCSNDVVTLDFKPGDLQLFEGRYSMHRVTASWGSTGRSVALLSYCDRPGEIGEASMQLMQYGRVSRTPLMFQDTHEGVR